MNVTAKCIMDAFDSPSCQHFKMGSTYEIDRDGPLAQLKTSGGKLGKYVFDFDRNGTKTNDGVDVVKDYSCKKDGCAAKFKTLNALGTHTKSAHKDDPNPLAEPDAEVEIVKPSTCKQCDPPQVFNSRGEMMKHKGEVHGASFFKKLDKAAVEQAA